MAERDDRVLRCTDVHVSVGTHEILRGVSLDIRAGEIVGLLGESGSGKSTLLRAILGLRAERQVVRGGSTFEASG